MDYRSIKWTIFTVLSLTAPAMLFLVMAVVFIPAIFFVGGIVYVIPKAFIPAHTTESLSFIVIFSIHALVYAGLYYGVSVLLAKVITRIKGRVVRNCITVAFLLRSGACGPVSSLWQRRARSDALVFIIGAL